MQKMGVPHPLQAVQISLTEPKRGCSSMQAQIELVQQRHVLFIMLNTFKHLYLVIKILRMAGDLS